MNTEPWLCAFRVRSVIILQEKAQDREKLLLKFLKIMKVTPLKLSSMLRQKKESEIKC